MSSLDGNADGSAPVAGGSGNSVGGGLSPGSTATGGEIGLAASFFGNDLRAAARNFCCFANRRGADDAPGLESSSQARQSGLQSIPSNAGCGYAGRQASNTRTTATNAIFETTLRVAIANIL